MLTFTKTVTNEQLQEARESLRPYIHNEAGEIFDCLIASKKWKETRFYYALQNDEIQGGISYIYRNDVLFIKYLVVMPWVQKQGIGRKLLLYTALQAMYRRVKKVELATLEESKKFYTKLGFKPVGYWEMEVKTLIKKIKQSFHLTPNEFKSMISIIEGGD